MKRILLGASIASVACIVSGASINCGGGTDVVPGGSSSSGGASGSGSGAASSSSSSGGSGSSGAGGSTSSSGGNGSSSSSSGGSSTSSGGGSSTSSSGGSSSGASSSSSSGSSSGGSSSSGSGSSSGGGTACGPLCSIDNEWWLLKCGAVQSYSDLVCQNAPSGGCNSTMPYLTRGTINRDQTVTVGGTMGTTYMVTAHFQGVVEPKTYTGGVKANPTVKTDGWYAPSSPTAATQPAPSQSGNYNVYMISVTPPGGTAAYYFLNALGNQTPAVPEAHFSYMIDYTATFPVAGGSAVRFLADDSNCSAIKNCDSTSIDNSGGRGTCNPITVPNLPTTMPAAGQTFNPTTALPFSQPYNGQFIIMTITSVQ